MVKSKETVKRENQCDELHNLCVLMHFNTQHTTLTDSYLSHIFEVSHVSDSYTLWQLKAACVTFVTTPTMLTEEFKKAALTR